MEQYYDQLANLVRVSWIVLIPVGVLLTMVLYKLLMLLQSVSQFLTLAQYELSPAMKDIRLTAAHVETISAKAAHSMESVERGIQNTKPAIERGMHSVRELPNNIRHGVASLFSGLRHSFTTRQRSY